MFTSRRVKILSHTIKENSVCLFRTFGQTPLQTPSSVTRHSHHQTRGILLYYLVFNSTAQTYMSREMSRRNTAKVHDAYRSTQEREKLSTINVCLTHWQCCLILWNKFLFQTHERCISFENINRRARGPSQNVPFL